MKTIKVIHSILGTIPFIWLILFLIVLVTGSFSIGHMPEYGDPIDPGSFNIRSLSFMHFVFYILSFISFFLWIIITTIVLMFFRKKIYLQKIPTVLFITGVAGFFIFKYAFTDNFLWVFD